MDKFDRMIAEELGEEDRRLLADYAEPGFFRLAFGLLRGPTGWVALVLLTVQSAMFVAALWAGWHFYTATEPVAALKWGLSAAVLALTALQLKMALMPQMQADRVILALRRLEVVLSRKG